MKILKTFNSFISESLTDDDAQELAQMGFGKPPEPKLETGQSVEFPNWLYLTSDQLYEIGLDLSGESDDLYQEIQAEMEAPVEALINATGDYAYVHITVDLTDRIYTIHGVYDADPGTYSCTINRMIDNTGIIHLPMTFALPDKFIQLLNALGEDDAHE
jgi:hypothetical protein